MRNIVQQFLDNPSPKLRKQLTTMELNYARKQRAKNEKKAPPKEKSPEPKLTK